MKRIIGILLGLLLLCGCSEKNNPLTPPSTHQDLTGQWLTSMRGYNINILLSQTQRSLTGSGMLLVNDPYSYAPVTVTGVVMDSIISLGIHEADGTLVNFTGRVLNDSTIFGTLRGYVPVPMPIVMNRRYL